MRGTLRSGLLWGVLSGSVRAEEPPSTESDLIYFILVDRFADGTAEPGLPIEPEDPQGFHGGDLQGVIDHLDHLESMGVETLWISPVTLGQSERAGPWGAYHGYWPVDHFKVDPRFGDFPTLARLADELHSRNMRLVLDMVYNHVGYSSTLPEEAPDWFHPTGDIVDWSDPLQRRTHRVHGLPDLDQTHPEVVDYLSRFSLQWLEESGADGIRVDAIGHMEPEFIASLSERFDQAGRSTWILGEDFQGDPLALAETVRRANLDAIFDFPLYYALTDTICDGRSMGRLASTLSQDRAYATETELITFLDNHDLPRIATRCASTEDGVRMALHLLFSLRGTPTITYGTEFGLQGEEEPLNRGDVPWEIEPLLRDEIGQLQTLRERGPEKSRDRVLFMNAESLLLLRSGSDRSLLLLIHRGDDELRLDWPSGLSRSLKATAVLHDGVFQSDEMTEAPEQIRAPPHSLSRWYVAGSMPSQSTLQSLRFEIDHPPTCEGSRVFITGAGTELGNWNPEAGLELHSAEGSGWKVELQAHESSVLAWHPVVVHPDGEMDWESGPDHYTWIPPGADTQVDHITWSGNQNCKSQ